MLQVEDWLQEIYNEWLKINESLPKMHKSVQLTEGQSSSAATWSHEQIQGNYTYQMFKEEKKVTMTVFRFHGFILKILQK